MSTSTSTPIVGKPLTLRCKTRSGQHVISSLTSESRVSDLADHLVSYTPDDPGKQLKVLYGYPPRELDLTAGQQRLGDVFQEREMLMLEEVAVQRRSSSSSDDKPDVAKHETPAPEPTDSTKEPDQRSTSTTNGNANGTGNGSNPVVPEKRLKTSHHDSSESKSTSNPPKLLTGDIDGDNELPPGSLVRRPVPANNSCLFTSVYFCLSGGEYNHTMGITLRQIIADTVAGDPVKYSDGLLGQSNPDYCRWILNSDHWGGAIELAILAAYYSIEIVAVDIINLRINRFGEDKQYPQRMVLIYDGIHYDPLAWSPNAAGAPVITTFPRRLTTVLDHALDVAAQAKAAREFTDVNNFTLRCLVCNTGLTGQTAAQQHAKATGHMNFGEV